MSGRWYSGGKPGEAEGVCGDPIKEWMATEVTRVGRGL